MTRTEIQQEKRIRYHIKAIGIILYRRSCRAFNSGANALQKKIDTYHYRKDKKHYARLKEKGFIK